MQYDGVTDPLSIELLACQDAMILARDMGWQSVLVETDCREIQSMWISSQKSTGFHTLREMEEIFFFEGREIEEVSNLLQGFELRISGRQSN